MKQKTFFVLMILSVMILSGCADNGDTASETTPYVGGQTGVVMSFESSAPPDEIFDNGNYKFGIGVKLENKGESDIDKDNAYVEIIGINPTDFGTTSSALKKNLNEDLQGVKKNSGGETLNGGIGMVEFPNLQYSLDLPGNIQPTIRAELCYDYTTKTTTLVCIKKNLLQSISDDRICTLDSKKDPQNSGAPIHITSMTETPMGENKIQFLFIISHVGAANDRIYKKGTECDYSVTNTDKNKVYVKITSSVNGKKPSCMGLQEASSDGSEGYVTMYDMKPATVTCSLDVSTATNIFETPLNIELSYRYSQFIEKPVLIKNVG